MKFTEIELAAKDWDQNRVRGSYWLDLPDDSFLVLTGDSCKHFGSDGKLKRHLKHINAEKLCDELERQAHYPNRPSLYSDDARQQKQRTTVQKQSAGVQRFPRLASSEKASASAAVFESTDPRYCVKLFPTLSKKYPGQASIHIYQNPQRQHKFYTMPIKTAICETEKFLALLRQMSQEEK